METEFQYVHMSDFHQLIPGYVVETEIEIPESDEPGEGKQITDLHEKKEISK